MVNIFITVKPSKRFPGKNDLLWKYTYLWLLSEKSIIKENVAIYIVGDENEIKNIPNNIKIISVNTGGHLSDILAAESIIQPDKNDVFVLTQLTQPLRENGLLEKIVESARKNNSAISVTKQQGNWREVDNNGGWNGNYKTDKLCIDGALFAWTTGNAKQIFTPGCKHGLVLNNSPLIDIDVPDDIPDWLDTAWAKLMLKK